MKNSSIHNFFIYLFLAISILLLTYCAEDETEISNDTPYVWIGGNSTLMHSLDAGLSWEDYSGMYDIEEYGKNLKSVVFYNTTTGFFLSSTIHKTENASDFLHKYPLTTYDPNYIYTDIAFTGPNEYCFIGTDKIIRFDGHAFKQSFVEGQAYFYGLNSIEFYDESQGYIAGENGTIFCTTDSGNLWKVQQSLPTHS